MATSPVSSTPIAPFFPITPSSAWQSIANLANQCEIDTPTAANDSPSHLDPATREQMLLEHMSVVRFVARRIHERLPQHVELEDLIGAGTIGLIDAFNKFDRNKEVQFHSYAQFRIRGAILDSLRSLDWGSRDLRRKGREIEEAKQRLLQQWNRRPTEPEVAAELGMSLEQYQKLLGNLKSLDVGSLNELHSEDSSEEELAYVPTAAEEDPLFLCMMSERSAQLTAAVAELPERDARVLAMYYVEEMTLKEIGAVLHLGESRVSQIRAAAVLELRSRLTRPIKPREFSIKTRSRGQQGIPVAVMQKSGAHTNRVARMEMRVR